MSEQPKVSVIVPVYKAEKYLRRCLDSILGQTMSDFEVILIDDGSPDNSGEICDEYAAKDSRFRVIHKENGGASKARNIGLDIAKGKYVWFIDADDWIDGDALSKLMSDLDADIIFFGFKRLFKDGKTSICQIQANSSEFKYNYIDIIEKLFNSDEAYMGYTWNKLFKREILESGKIRFNEDLIIKEDEVFCFEYLRHTKSISISHLTPYNYRILDSSISHNINGKRNMLELAMYMQQNILADKFFFPMYSSICQAIYSYYWSAVIEGKRNRNSTSPTNLFLTFIEENKSILRLRGKHKFFLFVPTKIVKRFLIKVYFSCFYMMKSKIRKILRPIYRFIKTINLRKIFWKLKGCKLGKNVIIYKKVLIFNPKYVSIGKNTIIHHHTSLFVNPIDKSAQLIIGEGVQLGKYNDFGCSNKIIIEENVITAPFVHITDRDHTYQDINVPIMHQPANSKGPVIIKSGCRLGFGVQVMSGVTIGKQSVVAAGSIVTKDIPDYCVAGGNPAKILKKYNIATGKWEKV